MELIAAKLRASTDRDLPRILDIWRDAVDVTHDFLTPEDRQFLEAEVLSFFPQIHFHLAVEGNEHNHRALGFYKQKGFTPMGRSPLHAQGRTPSPPPDAHGP